MSTGSTEIELKFAVADAAAFDALLRHLDVAAREFQPTATQVNHFFDTPNYGLLEAGLVLRLREERGHYTLALKGRTHELSPDGAATARLEEEVRLAPDVALDVLQGQVSARDVLAKRISGRNPGAIALLNEALGHAELHYVGRFENVRTRVARVPVSVTGEVLALQFELDSTRFADRTDHEIEVELPARVDPRAAHAAVAELLADARVAWHPTSPKAQRFFTLVRGEQSD